MLTIQSAKSINLILPSPYRYMDKEYVEMFFETGVLRISSFRRFQNYPDEIRGDASEGGGIYETFSKEGLQHITMTNTGSNRYLLCSSFIHSKTIMKEFNVNSCIKIKDPINFSNAMMNSVIGSTEAL